MSTPKFGKFSQVILCDDVRQETNGKYIIIGLFTSDILVNEFPAYLPLRLLITYEMEEIGDQKLDFLWFLDDKPLIEMEGGVRQETLGAPIVIALPPGPLHVDGPGRLRVSARLESGEQLEILSRSLRRSETPIAFI
jgi:hypothetical protein